MYASPGQLVKLLRAQLAHLRCCVYGVALRLRRALVRALGVVWAGAFKRGPAGRILAKGLHLSVASRRSTKRTSRACGCLRSRKAPRAARGPKKVRSRHFCRPLGGPRGGGGGPLGPALKNQGWQDSVWDPSHRLQAARFRSAWFPNRLPAFDHETRRAQGAFRSMSRPISQRYKKAPLAFPL